MASDLAAAGLRAIGTVRNIFFIKGGMGVGKPIFQEIGHGYGEIVVNRKPGEMETKA